MNEDNSGWLFSNGEDIPNWNYNPNANVHNNYEIPYFDLNGDGVINVLDITMVINHITGGEQLTHSQIQRLKYNATGDLQSDYDKNIVNILDIVNLVNVALVI